MMKATINIRSKQVYIDHDFLDKLTGWNIYIRRPYKGFVGYEASINGLYTLAEAVSKGPPTPPPTTCCACSCHSQGYNKER